MTNFKGKSLKLVGTSLLASTLVFSSFTPTLIESHRGVHLSSSSDIVAQAKTKKKSKTTKKATKKNPYGKKNSKLKVNTIYVGGSNALEQYIAKQMYLGKTKISLKSFQNYKKQVTWSEVMTNTGEMNPTLLGITGVSYSKERKYGIPTYIYVSYGYSQTSLKSKYKQLGKKVTTITKATNKKKTTYDKYKYIYDTLSKYTRNNEVATASTSYGSKNRNSLDYKQYLLDTSVYGALIKRSANSYGMASAFQYLAERAGLKSEVVYATYGEGIRYINTMKFGSTYVYVDTSRGTLSTGLSYFAYGMSSSTMSSLGYKVKNVKSPVTFNDDKYEYYTYNKLYATNLTQIANIITNYHKTGKDKTSFYLRLSGDLDSEDDVKILARLKATAPTGVTYTSVNFNKTVNKSHYYRIGVNYTRKATGFVPSK